MFHSIHKSSPNTIKNSNKIQDKLNLKKEKEEIALMCWSGHSFVSRILIGKSLRTTINKRSFMKLKTLLKNDGHH